MTDRLNHPTDRTRDKREVAEYLGVSTITVVRKAASGEWPGRRVGNSWRFTEADLEKILDLCANPPAKSAAS